MHAAEKKKWIRESKFFNAPLVRACFEPSKDNGAASRRILQTPVARLRPLEGT